MIKKGTAIIAYTETVSDSYAERHEVEISVVEKTTGNYTEILTRKVRDELYAVENGVDTLMGDDSVEGSYRLYHGVSYADIFNQYLRWGDVTWTTPLAEV